LLADDDATTRRSLERALERLAFDVVPAEDERQAATLLAADVFDVVLSGLVTAAGDGLAVLETTQRLQPQTAVVVMTEAGDLPACVRAMRAGAFDVVSKPYDLDVLAATLGAALDARRALPLPPAPAREAVFGISPAARALGQLVNRVASTNATVLITGETGVGKEVVARALHAASARAAGPLVAVNCAALPEGLIESELFGHVAGAFTGATTDRGGRVREAEGGTLFLDEIGDLPLTLQTRLLRVTQERTVLPVGSRESHAVDVRFVAATNRDLAQLVRVGQFRQDLYFRLNVVPIEVPPLRARVEDIPLLAREFLAGGAHSISDAAMAVLRLHAWPGNVRELKHAIERMAILDRDGVIDLDDLPERLRQGTAFQALTDVQPFGDENLDLARAVAEFERAFIARTLHKTGGNRSKAAQLLGIGRTTLLDKLKRLR
jgi:two-component system response regulator HydG